MESFVICPTITFFLVTRHTIYSLIYLLRKLKNKQNKSRCVLKNFQLEIAQAIMYNTSWQSFYAKHLHFIYILFVF